MANTVPHGGLLSQNGLSIWLIGLSGAGKSTLANSVKEFLSQKKIFSIVLDADEVRKGLNQGLGYAPDDRLENIRRVAEVSKMLFDNNVVAINAFICPLHVMQQKIFDIVGRQNCVLIYLSTPLNICEQRDTKGLYANARKGQISQFTGISAAFEPPGSPDLTIDTSLLNAEECTKIITDYILPKIVIND